MFILKKLMQHLSNFTWTGILIAIVFHMSTAYFGLYLFGETELVSNFFYYYTVTASTVGYGDFSPITVGGKYLVSLWIIPGGIAFFTAILGKIVSTIQAKVSLMKNGMGNFRNLKDHVIVIGYKQGETESLFRETEQKLGKTEKVVICTDGGCSHENWIKAETFTDQDAFDRAGITSASRVVIMLNSDGETTNTIMAVMSKIGTMKASERLPDVIAFIQDESQAKLIRANFPFVECVVSNKVSYMARSMADPGISELFEALISSSNGHTLYCYTIGASEHFTVDDFEKKYDCSVVAIKDSKNPIKFVNNHDRCVYKAGHMVYYISENRIQ